MIRTIAALAGFTLAIQVAPASAFDWNGFYAGVSAGYSFGHSDAAYDSPDIVQPPIPFSTFNLDSDPSGAFVGVTLGGNAAMGGGLVAGVEGDLSYGNITDTIADDFATYRLEPGNTITSTTDFSGTLRGRVGFDGGEFLPFLTAGLAGARVMVEATDGNLSEDATLFGWTAGGGVELATSDSMTVKAEYLYTDLGEHTWFEGELWSSTSHSTSNAFRLGLNFALD